MVKQILPFRKSSARKLNYIKEYGDYWFVDENNTKVFDGQSGLGAFSLGYKRNDIIEYVSSRQLHIPFIRTNHYIMSSDVDKLNETLAKDTKFEYVFYGLSGSDGVETAMKMALGFYGRKSRRNNFISFYNSYHGSTIHNTSLTGALYFHKYYGNLMPLSNHHYIEQPNDQWSEKIVLDSLRGKILEVGPENIAAVVKEPFSSQCGVRVPSLSFYQGIREICDQYQILFICDEVATGCMKSGCKYGYQRVGADPDIIVVAKALTAGYFPLSATLCKAHIGKKLYNSAFVNGWTFSPYMPGVYSAIKVDEISKVEQLKSNVRDMVEPCLIKYLANLKEKNLIIDFRVCGVFAGIDISSDIARLDLEQLFWKNGLQLTGVRKEPLLGFIMPISIDQNTLSEMLNIFENTLITAYDIVN